MTTTQHGGNRRQLGLIFLPALLFLLIFFFYPLLRIMLVSLSGLSLTELLGRRYIGRILWFTTWQAAVSTLLTLVAGLPIAYLLANYEFRGKALLRAISTVPFVMPTVVVAAAFRALLAPAGPLNQLAMALTGLAEPPLQLEQSLYLILLAHAFYNITIVVRLVGGFWANLNPNLGDSARILGARPLRQFWEITLPLLRPVLISAAILIFLFCFTSFGVVLILGGPAFSTIETEIYRQYVTFLRPDIAGALSLLQIVFTFILMTTYARWQQRATVALSFRPQQASLRRPDTLWKQWLLSAVVLSMGLVMSSPLLALIWRSLTTREGTFTFDYYLLLQTSRVGQTAYIAPLTAVLNSLGFALLTVLTAGLLGVSSAYVLSRAGRGRRWLDAGLMLPLGASAVTLGFGYVVTFSRLRTSPLLVLIAHTLVAMPFIVRAVLPVMLGIKESLREAAAQLGAPPGRVWREVDLPILSRALLVGAIFAFTVSMGEFGATSFVARPNSGFQTLPIAIERFLGQPGAELFGQALALSTILMLVCAVGFIGIERFRYADIGEF
ncbi:MAG: iron ABC transporter permease [Anaerolineales bacterium]|nr:iron ABC transporter permease [Anaerolineales bacterium]MCB0018947.1 iron ABC transporter permease [Anaerolineales bacterium]